MNSTSKPLGCTNLKLRQLGRIVTRHYDQHLTAVGLRNTQYALLSYAMKLGPIRPSDLARQMQIDASTLTRNLQLMVKEGWLMIGEGEDARSRIIKITPEGLKMRAKGQRAWKEAQHTLNDLLGLQQVSALHDLLDASIAVLGESD